MTLNPNFWLQNICYFLPDCCLLYLHPDISHPRFTISISLRVRYSVRVVWTCLLCFCCVRSLCWSRAWSYRCRSLKARCSSCRRSSAKSASTWRSSCRSWRWSISTESAICRKPTAAPCRTWTKSNKLSLGYLHLTYKHRHAQMQNHTEWHEHVKICFSHQNASDVDVFHELWTLLALLLNKY